jgi:predicted CXXCH cytochrome family protein
MPKHRERCKYFLLLGGTLSVIVCATLLLAGATPALAGEPSQETETYCLSCHANPDLSLTLPSGESLSLHIAPEMVQNSIHSQAGIECEACHTEIKTYPHPKIDYQSARELSRAYYLACQKCHSSNYELTQDSMHAQAAIQGNLEAPVCTDCHGAHDVQSPNQPRTLISDTCGQCHAAINESYRQSVHGGALIDENNLDVPVCTDCHGVHNIQDPRTSQFRVDTPDLCAECHANAELMDKYGLSADVYSLYQTSWHGVDISVYKANWPTIWHESAVCTDCHGVHDILKTDDPRSMVNETNLLATCQNCHPGAGENWTDAWTGHNQISFERTPFLFYVDAFYKTLVPAVLWGSIIYVVLQVLRASVERVRSSLP